MRGRGSTPPIAGMNKTLDCCKPSVHRCWLIFAAGLVWLAVGIGLIAVACFWLYHTAALSLGLVLAAVSIAAGLIVYSFGFSKIVRKNVDRIGGKPEAACLFGFQGWRSYFLILTMMLLGYALRHLPISKDIAAVIYFTMGSALCLGSLLYFREFSAQSREK